MQVSGGARQGFRRGVRRGCYLLDSETDDIHTQLSSTTEGRIGTGYFNEIDPTLFFN